MTNAKFHRLVFQCEDDDMYIVKALKPNDKDNKYYDVKKIDGTYGTVYDIKTLEQVLKGEKPLEYTTNKLVSTFRKD